MTEEKPACDSSYSSCGNLPPGMGIGLVFGVALGVALDDLTIGMCLGVALGPTFGLGMDAARKK